MEDKQKPFVAGTSDKHRVLCIHAKGFHFCQSGLSNNSLLFSQKLLGKPVGNLWYAGSGEILLQPFNMQGEL